MKRSTLLLGVALLAGSATAVVAATDNESTMQSLQLTKMAQPAFPSAMTTLGIPSGDVTIAISRDAAGTPTDILIIESSHSLFSDAALEAVRQWRFAPTDELTARTSAPAVVRLSFSFQGVISVHATIENQFNGNSGAGIRARPIVLPTMQALEASPKPLNYKDPEYPATMAAKGAQGEAKVSFYVDGEGKVRMPHVISASAPEFGAAAVAAVSNWRFNPPRRNGSAVVAADSWTFQFKHDS